MPNILQKFIPQGEVVQIQSLDFIKQCAEYALSCCPSKLKKDLANISITVENLVPNEVMQELKIEKKNELLGLYKILESQQGHELILYRNPLIMYAKTYGEDIAHVVSRVTIYEISHRANCTNLRKQWLDKVKKKLG